MGLEAAAGNLVLDYPGSGSQLPKGELRRTGRLTD